MILSLNTSVSFLYEKKIFVHQLYDNPTAVWLSIMILFWFKFHTYTILLT